MILSPLYNHPKCSKRATLIFWELKTLLLALLFESFRSIEPRQVTEKKLVKTLVQLLDVSIRLYELDPELVEPAWEQADIDASLHSMAFAVLSLDIPTTAD